MTNPISSSEILSKLSSDSGIVIKDFFKFKDFFETENKTAPSAYVLLDDLMFDIGFNPYLTIDSLDPHYIGSINDELMIVRFIRNHKTLYLYLKSYIIKHSDNKIIKHRINKPARYRYQSDGYLCQKEYFQNDEWYREDGKPSNFIYKRDLVKCLEYHNEKDSLIFPKFIILNKDVECIDDIVVSSSDFHQSDFSVDSRIFPIERIIEVVERIKQFKVRQLYNLSEHLSFSEIALILMYLF